MTTQWIKKHITKGLLFVFLIFCTYLSYGSNQPEVIEIIPDRITESEIGRLPEDPKSFDFDAFESRVQLLWFKRKAYLNANRIQDAEKQMAMLKAFCQQESIRRLPTIARSLSFEGIHYYQEGNFEKAKMSFQHAIYFDPFLIQPRIELAKTYWKEGSGLWKALKELFQAAGFFLKNFWLMIMMASNLMLLFLMSLLALFILFSILMAWKHNRSLRHEVAEYFEGRWSKHGIFLMGWLILFLPLFTFFGTIFLFLYWVLLLFRYMNRKERALSFIFLTLFFFVVPSLMLVRSVFNIAVDEEVRISLEAATCSYDPEKIIKLQQQIKNHPHDPTYHFLIANLYKRGGYYQESFNHYSKVFDLDPGSYQALNNLGNIFYRFGHYSQAITYYKKALQINPKFILAYLNLSLTQTESFDFKDAEETMNEARRINADEVAQWMTKKKSQESLEVIDATIDASRIWKKAFLGKANLASSDQMIKKEPFLYGSYFNILSIGSLLSMIILFIMLFRGGPQVYSCAKCGRISCSKCGYYKEYPNYCTHCVHLFIKKDGLEPHAEIIKLKEVQRYERLQKSVYRILGLIIPGSSQILEGKTFSGIFLAFLWILSLSGLLTSEALLHISDPGMISFSSIFLPVFIFFILISWFMGNRNLFKKQKDRIRYGP